MDVDLSMQQEGPQSTTVGTTLSAQQFYQHDPLLVLLKNKWRLNDLWIIAGAIVTPGIVFSFWWFWVEYVVGSKVQIWIPGDTVSALLQTFATFPLLVMIYLLIPASIARLFNTLRANRVIGESRRERAGSESYEDFVRQLVTWMDKSWWAAMGLVVVVLYLFCRLLLIELHNPSSVPFWLRACALVMWLPLMYATLMSVVRLLLTLVFTNWLFYRFTILVKPLHPDGSGGLGALGHLLWLSVGIMFWDALLLSTALVTSHMTLFSFLEILPLAAIYVSLTPSLLIGWLYLPHRVMVKARDEALLPLTEEFRQTFQQTMPSVGDDTASIVAGTSRLAALKQRYDLVQETFPTWPVEVQDLRRLVATGSLPALLPLLLPLVPPLITFLMHGFNLPLK